MIPTKILIKLGIPVGIFFLGAFAGYQYASALGEAKYESLVSEYAIRGVDGMTEAQRRLEASWKARLIASEELHRQSEAAHRGAAEDAKRLSGELAVMQNALEDAITNDPECQQWVDFQIGCPVEP